LRVKLLSFSDFFSGADSVLPFIHFLRDFVVVPGCT
jgi:hypothetical protein